MKKKDVIEISPLEENKLFFIYDYEFGPDETISQGSEKIFILHLLNKFGYLDSSIIKDGFGKIGFNLDDDYFKRSLIGPFLHKAELENCLKRFLEVLGYCGAILVSFREFNEVLKTSKNIQEVKGVLFEKGELLEVTKKDNSSKSFIKKIFG